ncbi:MAG: wax ester/triacylglycerol synthase family O-acyltransferase [Pseudomonadales bacterium]|nr:wax ester/triacylglycerol synthase family O-acyltransferase [Pseudomonadales bacterium]
MKQLGITDSAFINLEHPYTPQHIGSFGIYDQSTAPGGQVRFKQVIAFFERQLKQMPMFRTRLVTAARGFARQYWHVDEDFDVEFHVRHLALPAPGDWRQLCILIARLHSRPLDMTRPLWESYIIEGLDNIPHLPKGCFVIYNKLHHSLVDGGGANGFMQAIHDLEPVVHEVSEADQQATIYSEDSHLTKGMIAGEMTKNYIDNIWKESKGGIDTVSAMFRSGMQLAKGDVNAPPITAPETRFNQPVRTHRVIESASFDLEALKQIKNLNEVKLNDVVLAIVSGGMRKYLEHYRELPKQPMVATVPMNMRSRRDDTGENNQVGSMFANLNSDIDDPLERLRAIHRSTEEAKAFSETSPLKDTLKIAGALSPRFTQRLVRFYVDNDLTKKLPFKVNTVVSNVAGPPMPLYASGAKLVQYGGLGVLTPGVGLFHLAFTYMGEMSITILADRNMLPDPQFYRECLEAAFQELKDLSVSSANSDKAKSENAKPVKTKAKAEAKAKTKAKATVKTKAKAKTKPQAKTKTNSKTKTKSKAKPKLAATKTAAAKPEAIDQQAEASDNTASTSTTDSSRRSA